MPERAAKGRFPKGNGPGAGQWGGPAKGAGQPPGNADAGRPLGVKTGEGKRSVADLMIEAGARELAAQRWVEILNNPKHPKHADMVSKAADRMDGTPTQKVQASGEDGGPLIVERVIVRPKDRDAEGV